MLTGFLAPISLSLLRTPSVAVPTTFHLEIPKGLLWRI